MSQKPQFKDPKDNPENCTANFICKHSCYKSCIWNKEFLNQILDVNSTKSD